MIRLANSGDIEASLEIALEFIDSGYYSFLPSDINIMRAHAMRALEEPNWLYLVEDLNGVQSGFFSAHIEGSLFGKGEIAYQDLMYIRPEYRKGTAAVRFMRRFEDWARQNNCMSLYFAPSVNVDSRLDRLAKRLGYEYLGPQYGKKL